MSYNTTKFPADVSRLFKPRPPLEHKKPIDYPPEKRQTCPHISGVSQLLGSSLTSYLKEFPEGSKNQYLLQYEKAVNSKNKEWRKLEHNLLNWDPNNDPNMKDTDPYRTVFIGRLPYDITEIELQKKFNNFGEIEKIRVVRDKTSGTSKGYAFVVFTDPQSSKMACKEYGLHKGIEIKGRTCIVDIERGRTVKYFKPRRLGGGLGGRGYTKANNMARFTNDPSVKYSGNFQKRSGIEPKRFQHPQASWGPGPRPRYTGPSRFSHSNAISVTPTAAPRKYHTHGTIPASAPAPVSASPVKTSYRSRTARAQEVRQDMKPEEPDY